MVSSLHFRLSSPGLSVEASPHSGVQMGTSEYNVEGNPSRD